MDARNLAARYELPTLDWAPIRARLDEGLTVGPGTGGPDHYSVWLATTNGDGSPHVTGVGALWVDGTFWFVSGDGTRKSRNLARDPRGAMSVSTEQFDLVLEGEARKVTDPEVVATMAARWADGGWPARVDDSGLALTADYSAPSAGPPPWFVYRLTPRVATALATTGDGGATTWRFE